MPLTVIEQIISYSYEQLHNANSSYVYRSALRNVAVLELLFSTGVRVSELCTLKNSDVDLAVQFIKVYGKGARERIIQIDNTDVIAIMIQYQAAFSSEIHRIGSFFINRLGKQFSEQSVRFMIKKYTKQACVGIHITPHMFRHPYVKPATKNNLLQKDFGYIFVQSPFANHNFPSSIRK